MSGFFVLEDYEVSHFMVVDFFKSISIHIGIQKNTTETLHEEKREKKLPPRDKKLFWCPVYKSNLAPPPENDFPADTAN